MKLISDAFIATSVNSSIRQDAKRYVLEEYQTMCMCFVYYQGMKPLHTLSKKLNETALAG